MKSIQRIIVVFKTHLDVGFTGLAESVVNRYLTSYIPNALEVAKASREGSMDPFIWTTGS